MKFTDRLKRLNFGDALIRRNPLFYRTARARLAAPRPEWLKQRLEKVLRAARATPYGRRVNGGDQLASWPLLEKAALRAEPDAFRAPGLHVCVGGSTGGTTGLPLRLVRS
ncbi:MAG TPA: hypothetical protein VFR83_05685, partial [Burkholderiales bacterium]|nr:hypothetical protein [Burkholderiales bacterium]